MKTACRTAERLSAAARSLAPERADGDELPKALEVCCVAQLRAIEPLCEKASF
jgi:hypothetical protein